LSERVASSRLHLPWHRLPLLRVESLVVDDPFGQAGEY
jgi:hypothetical protein